MSEHGYGPYSNGCRCDVCRAAKRAYVAERRASGAERDRAVAVPAWNDRAPLDGRRAGLRRFRLRHVREHGTTTGYRLGCRCWPCTDAESAADRARRERRKAQRQAVA